VSAARDPGPDQRPAVGRESEAHPAFRGGAVDPAVRRRSPRRHFSGALRWLRPPRQLRPTRAGWSFFALTFGIGFAALNTGNNLLYLVLSLMLAFLVLSGVLSESALRGVALRRRVPRELYAESDAWVSVEIHNRQRRVVAYALVVEDRWIDPAQREVPAGRCFALRIAPGGSEIRSYRLRPEQRGELAFAGFVVSTRFPFGLFSKSLAIAAPERALVYPAIDPVPIPRDFAGVRESGEDVAGPRGRGAEVGGVREYQRGDAPRRIAWRASLRSRALWVREVESDHQGEVEVRLRTADRAAGARFERDVRGSASEVAALLERGLRVGLRTDREQLEPGAGAQQRARLLGFLARVEPDSRSAA
jgi:uncharacterized protein (DUF58 family)